MKFDITKFKAISIRQPWCHRILFDGKDVENRDWSTRFRGEVFIHASKTPEDAAYCREIGATLGGIVGIMEIVDCVTQMDSRWFFGKYGFVIRNARAIEFIPCVGDLGFFTPDPTKQYKQRKPRPPKAAIPPKPDPQGALFR